MNVSTYHHLGAMLGGGGNAGTGEKQRGTETSLTHSITNQVSTSNIVTASERLFRLTPYSEPVQHLKFRRMNRNKVKEARMKAGVIL